MAAFPAETDFSTTQAAGHVIATIGSTVVGRVISVGEIDHEDRYEPYTGFSSASIEQVVGYIKRAVGQGNFSFVTDSMVDIANNTGAKAVYLEQLYPADAGANLGWKFSATTAIVTCKTNITARAGASTMLWTVRPYNATPGSAAYTIDEATAYTS